MRCRIIWRRLSLEIIGWSHSWLAMLNRLYRTDILNHVRSYLDNWLLVLLATNLTTNLLFNPVLGNHPRLRLPMTLSFHQWWLSLRPSSRSALQEIDIANRYIIECHIWLALLNLKLLHLFTCHWWLDFQRFDLFLTLFHLEVVFWGASCSVLL